MSIEKEQSAKASRKRLRQLERLASLIEDILDECADEPKPDKGRAIDPCASEQSAADRAAMDETEALTKLAAASMAATAAVQARMDAEMALDECRANIGVGMPDDDTVDGGDGMDTSGN